MHREILSVRYCSMWDVMDQSDVIIEELYLVLCYVNRLQESVPLAFEFFDLFQKGRLVVLELGGWLDVFSAVLLQDFFVLLFNHLMSCSLFQTVCSGLVPYRLYGSVTSSRFRSKQVRETPVLNVKYLS